jgi:hypothetical protein
VGSVDIYCDTDTDSAVLDHEVASGVTASGGSYTWYPGYLAPGTYYVYIRDSGDPGTGAYSPGPLTIRPAPVAEVVAPSRTSGDDYAATELADSWDMSDSGDISWKHGLDSVTYSGGQMHATTVGLDNYVLFDSAGDDTIETDYYRYVTWRFYVEGDWADSRERLGGGSERWGVIRVFVQTGWGWSVYNDVIPWEGWNVYQMDLSRGGGKYYLDGTAPPSDPGWNGTASTMRLDFLEPMSGDSWPIHLDYFTLTADPRPDGSGDYEIQWQIQQGEPVTTTLYYTTNPGTSSCESGGTYIGQIVPASSSPPPGPFRVYLPLVLNEGVPSDATAFTWTSLPASGTYYVQISTDDGLNRTCWTSDAPLVIDP